MDTVDAMKAAVAEAATLVRAAERAARADGARAKVRMREASARAAESDDAGAEARVRVSMISWLPFAGRWRRRLEQRADRARASASDERRAAETERVRAGRLEALAGRAARARDRLRKADRAVDMLGYPPADIAGRAKRAASEARFASKTRPEGADRDGRWAAEAVSIAERAVATVRDWAQARAVVEARRRREAERQGRGQEVPQARRIYLPIPQTLGPVARDAGALLDRSAPRGASPWFVTHDMGLGPFRNLLPLAARPEPAGLSFPPVPYRASGQNLWGLFDAATWDHVRRQAYATTGRRCAVCGGRGEGFLAESLYAPDERRAPIECHEEWEWRVPRVADGIGVQSLRRLLVVCRACHSMFHGAYFTRRAEEAGIGRQVADAIEKRRMLVNRVTREQLGMQIEMQAEHLRKAAGVDRWVLDLGHLAQQSFMGQHVPILREDNAASLAPERVAGIAFETDSGRRFAARGVDEVLASLSRPRNGGDRIVPVPQRR